MTTGSRTNPTHWIWHTPLAARFTPDEHAYLALRILMPAHQVQHIEDMIAEGMSAEQMVVLGRLDEVIPAHVVECIGHGLAFWVQRAQEEGDA